MLVRPEEENGDRVAPIPRARLPIIIEAARRISSSAPTSKKAARSYVRRSTACRSRARPAGRPRVSDRRPDDKIVLEMVRFPTHASTKARASSRGARPAWSGGSTRSRSFANTTCQEEFAEDAVEKNRGARLISSTSVPRAATDLTGLVPSRSIRSMLATSTTPSARNQRESHWVLGVHIADVSHFVAAGHGGSTAAYARATVPTCPIARDSMIPEIISD